LPRNAFNDPVVIANKVKQSMTPAFMDYRKTLWIVSESSERAAPKPAT
jgi:hypothetical protein